VAKRGPLCVGIDPHPSLLASWGLASNAAGLEQCARGVIEALGAIVPVFKPQSAFFEAYGAAGIAVLERTLADIKAAGAPLGSRNVALAFRRPDCARPVPQRPRAAAPAPHPERRPTERMACRQ
jgi:hypothetical protein